MARKRIQWHFKELMLPSDSPKKCPDTHGKGHVSNKDSSFHSILLPIETEFYF